MAYVNMSFRKQSPLNVAYGFRECFWAIIDPCDEPTLLGIVYSGDTCATKVLDEFSESHPACRVHMQMVLVLNILLIHLVGLHPLGPKSRQIHNQYELFLRLTQVN